ncbi:MAG: hypothetical protein AAGJ83_13840 [Planctomycetota bacterium]
MSETLTPNFSLTMFFYFWVAVMLIAIIAVPVAIKMSPEIESAGGVDENLMEDPSIEDIGVSEEPAAFEEFGTAEPLADDAFEEFQ